MTQQEFTGDHSRGTRFFFEVVLSVFFVWLPEAVGANPNSAITVSPTDAVSWSTSLGVTPTPAEVVFTVVNSGRGVARWAAGVDVDWIELSPGSGVLRPHQQMQVQVKLRAIASFPVGRHPATVTFSNLSGRMPPIVRQAVLTIHFPSPALSPEPSFTRGTSNNVAWAWVAGANEYEVQAAPAPDFAGALSSGWFLGTNHTFTGLQDGVLYFYRVRCRTNAAFWSQTLAREFEMNENLNISTRTSPGEMVLAGNTNRIWFEDFDEPGSSWTNTLFSDLSRVVWPATFDRGPQDANTLAPRTSPPLPINQDGDKEGRLQKTIGQYSYAFFGNALQLRDVTMDAYLHLTSKPEHYIIQGGSVLRADPVGTNRLGGYRAQVRAFQNTRYRQFAIFGGSSGVGQSDFEAESLDENYHLRFSARGPLITATLWRVIATNGIIREGPVQMSNGTNVLTVLEGASASGVVALAGLPWSNENFAINSVFFDDVTIVAHDGPAHYASTGRASAVVAPPNWFERWGELHYTASANRPATEITVDLLDAQGDLLVDNVSSGTDLGAIPSLAPHRSLRLRANLTTADPAQTPSLSDWTVGFHLPTENASQSDWSEAGASTQDATPPSLTITSPAEDYFVSTNRVITLAGTAADFGSGISRVTLVNQTAVTTNGFANWTLSATLPNVGTNTLVVVARDSVAPANATFVLRRVIYEPLDMVPKLILEYQDQEMILTWRPDHPAYTLQIATTLSPPDWKDVPADHVSPLRFPFIGGSRFFRLVRQ